MKKSFKSLDLDKNLGTITLSDGETKLEIPKLSAARLIRIVKYLGVEIARLWESAADIGYDGSLTDQEKMIEILEMVPEEKLLGIISILTDLDEDSAMLLDINEILDIAIIYTEKTNLPKTFFQIRTLYQKIYDKEMPTFKEWMDRVFPAEAIQQVQEKAKEEPIIETAGRTASS